MMDRSSEVRVDLAFERDFELGAALVRPSLHQVVIAGEEKQLEPRVMQVLVALAHHSGKIVTRDQLLAQCWEGRAVSDDAINRAISRLRSLTEVTEHPTFRIETLPRVGYRLFSPEPQGHLTDADSAGAAATAPGARSWHGIGSSPAFRVAAASVVIGLLGVAAVGESARSSQPGRETVSLAILPFADLSADQSCKYFGRGIAEEIAVMLSADPQLEVKAGLSRPEEDYRAVSKALGVSHVLGGSVRRRGDSVRVTVRLVDAATGAQLWASDYERSLADGWSTQRDIGSQVAKNILSRESAGQLERGHATDGETYRLYLTAVGMIRSGEKDRLKQAEGLLQKVVERDPDFQPGRVWLSISQSELKQAAVPAAAAGPA